MDKVTHRSKARIRSASKKKSPHQTKRNPGTKGEVNPHIVGFIAHSKKHLSEEK